MIGAARDREHPDDANPAGHHPVITRAVRARVLVSTSIAVDREDRVGAHIRARRPSALLLAAMMLLAGCGSSPPASRHDAPRLASYVALGDSYTAAPLVPRTNLDNGCLRSTHNYPSLVARDLDVADFADRSCSGASTTDLTSAQRAGVPPQLDALNRRTDLVTVGIGGNDFHVFGTIVDGCTRDRAADPAGAPCRAQMRASGSDRLLAVMPRITAAVTSALAEIRRRAPQAKVVVVGYPQIVPRSAPPAGACPQLPLARGDFSYAYGVNRALDAAVRAAATATGSTWVDIWSASRGHDICSPHPWINGSVTQPDRAAAYHPFGVEQRAVARLVERAVS